MKKKIINSSVVMALLLSILISRINIISILAGDDDEVVDNCEKIINTTTSSTGNYETSGEGTAGENSGTLNIGRVTTGLGVAQDGTELVVNGTSLGFINNQQMASKYGVTASPTLPNGQTNPEYSQQIIDGWNSTYDPATDTFDESNPWTDLMYETWCGSDCGKTKTEVLAEIKQTTMENGRTFDILAYPSILVRDYNNDSYYALNVKELLEMSESERQQYLQDPNIGKYLINTILACINDGGNPTSCKLSNDGQINTDEDKNKCTTSGCCPGDKNYPTCSEGGDDDDDDDDDDDGGSQNPSEIEVINLHSLCQMPPLKNYSPSDATITPSSSSTKADCETNPTAVYTRVDAGETIACGYVKTKNTITTIVKFPTKPSRYPIMAGRSFSWGNFSSTTTIQNSVGAGVDNLYNAIGAAQENVSNITSYIGCLESAIAGYEAQINSLKNAFNGCSNGCASAASSCASSCQNQNGCGCDEIATKCLDSCSSTYTPLISETQSLLAEAKGLKATAEGMMTSYESELKYLNNCSLEYTNYSGYTRTYNNTVTFDNAYLELENGYTQKSNVVKAINKNDGKLLTSFVEGTSRPVTTDDLVNGSSNVLNGMKTSVYANFTIPVETNGGTQGKVYITVRNDKFNDSGKKYSGVDENGQIIEYGTNDNAGTLDKETTRKTAFLYIVSNASKNFGIKSVALNIYHAFMAKVRYNSGVSDEIKSEIENYTNGKTIPERKKYIYHPESCTDGGRLIEKGQYDVTGQYLQKAGTCSSGEYVAEKTEEKTIEETKLTGFEWWLRDINDRFTTLYPIWQPYIVTSYLEKFENNNAYGRTGSLKCENGFDDCNMINPNSFDSFKNEDGTEEYEYSCDLLVADVITGCTNEPCIDIIYRPISLSNPFPDQGTTGSRKMGSNWNENLMSAFITNNRGVKEDAVYSLEPLYTIVLTPSNIKEIREYNKSVDENNVPRSYSDFDLNCNSNGDYCESKFLREYLNEIGAIRNDQSCAINLNESNWYSCHKSGGVE